LQDDTGGSKETARTPLFGKPPRSALPLPLPPGKDKPAVALEFSTDSKLAAVKAYRRAMGLCYKFGLKWTKDHKCSPEVLHAIRDFWDILSDDDCVDHLYSSCIPQEKLFLALSKSAFSGARAIRTTHFTGSLAGIPITFLLDSGSSSSFVNESIVRQLSSQTVLPQPTLIHVGASAALHRYTVSLPVHSLTMVRGKRRY